VQEVFDYYLNISVLEWIAVFASLAYVIFAAKRNILCWPAALISTALYTYIFYEYYLWMDSTLQVYYMVMAFYGWYCWKKPQANSDELTIITWKSQRHLLAIPLLGVVGLVIGYYMDNYTPADFPYVDALTTVYAVFATYLVTQRVLENWLYWIVIDAVSIYVYIEKDLQPTAALFVLYTIIAIFGYFAWQKKFSKQTLVYG